MVTVNKVRLDKAMEKESIDIDSLNYTTRENMYNTLIHGQVSLSDINDVASLLGCSPSYLMGMDNKEKKPEKKKSAEKRKYNKSGFDVMASRVKSRMNKLGWTQVSLGDYTGIPAASICVYAHCDTSLSVDTIKTMAYGLDCSLEYLVGKSDDYTVSPNYGVLGKYKDNVKMKVVHPRTIKALLNSTGTTPSRMAKAIGVPAKIFKRAMSTGTLPAHSADKLQKIADSERNKSAYVEPRVPVSEHEMLKARERVEEMSTTLTKKYFEDKEQEKLDAEARKALADTIPDMVKNRKDITIAMSKPSNGYISTGQLLSLAAVTERHPELLNLFAEITDLGEEDYNNIVNHIKWMVDVLKRSK